MGEAEKKRVDKDGNICYNSEKRNNTRRIILLIAICDDQIEAIEELHNLLTRYCDTDLVLRTYQNPSDLLAYAETNPLDILFLDIALMGENGIDIAAKLKQIAPNVQIIFVSGYLHYAPYVFDVEPIYFLTKPIQEEMLQKALLKARNALQQNNGYMFETVSKGVLTRIPIAEIRCFQNNRRMIHIYAPDERAAFYGKLDELNDERFKHFVRCHKSFFVNMRHIKQFGKTEIILDNDAVIPISQSRGKETKIAFHQYLGAQLK